MAKDGWRSKRGVVKETTCGLLHPEGERERERERAVMRVCSRNAIKPSARLGKYVSGVELTAYWKEGIA